MSEGDDLPEYTGPLAPSAEGDYLSDAANWLALADQEFAFWTDDRNNASERTDARMRLTAVGRLAELNIAMANACGGYQHRRRVAPFRQRYAAPSIADMKAMSEAIDKKIAADQAEHEGVRLTGGDPEPESTAGDLWIDVEPPGPDRNPYLYKLGLDRWTWANDYAEVLRSPGMGASWATCTDGGYVVRRPSQEERERFYAPPETPCECCAGGLLNAGADGDPCRDCGHAGPAHYVPEQDYAPTPPEAACGQFDSGDNGANPITATSICERCGASAAAHIQAGLRHLAEVGVDSPPPIPVRHVQAAPEVADLWAFTDRAGMALAELTPDELRAVSNAVGKLIPVKEGRQAPPRGGHEEWRG